MGITESCDFYSLPSCQIRIVLRHTVRVLSRGENVITEVGTVSDNSMDFFFQNCSRFDGDIERFRNLYDRYHWNNSMSTFLYLDKINEEYFTKYSYYIIGKYFFYIIINFCNNISWYIIMNDNKIIYRDIY